MLHNYLFIQLKLSCLTLYNNLDSFQNWTNFQYHKLIYFGRYVFAKYAKKIFWTNSYQDFMYHSDYCVLIDDTLIKMKSCKPEHQFWQQF